MTHNGQIFVILLVVKHDVGTFGAISSKAIT